MCSDSEDKWKGVCEVVRWECLVDRARKYVMRMLDNRGKNVRVVMNLGYVVWEIKYSRVEST